MELSRSRKWLTFVITALLSSLACQQIIGEEGGQLKPPVHIVKRDSLSIREAYARVRKLLPREVDALVVCPRPPAVDVEVFVEADGLGGYRTPAGIPFRNSLLTAEWIRPFKRNPEIGIDLLQPGIIGCGEIIPEIEGDLRPKGGLKREKTMVLADCNEQAVDAWIKKLATRPEVSEERYGRWKLWSWKSVHAKGSQITCAILDKTTVVVGTNSQTIYSLLGQYEDGDKQAKYNDPPLPFDSEYAKQASLVAWRRPGANAFLPGSDLKEEDESVDAVCMFLSPKEDHVTVCIFSTGESSGKAGTKVLRSVGFERDILFSRERKGLFKAVIRTIPEESVLVEDDEANLGHLALDVFGLW